VEATVCLDLDDGDTLRCLSCDADYTVAEVEAVLASWAAYLPWIKTCPSRQPQAAVKAAS
jgi:hypothetical protein